MTQPSFYAIHESYVLHQTVIPFSPWDFAPTPEMQGQITPQIRHDKDTRQAFYRNPNTKWNFYSPFCGYNPNQRISKDNPARLMNGFTADIDIEQPIENIRAIVRLMSIKPSRIETSLGMKHRLVWEFPHTLLVDSNEFCAFILHAAIKWLRLGLCAGLDEPAFVNPSRYYCNGVTWESTGHGPISEVDLQAFYVETASEYKFKSADAADIPLDIIEEALRKKFPNLASWPGNFDVKSQGPSFWIPESTSPMSAIVKKEGMLTFSAHADKPFYPWGDEAMLGKEFVKDFANNAIAKATANIFWDGKHFWQSVDGMFKSVAMPQLLNYFRMQCNLSERRDKNGKSPVDAALNHIYYQNVIDSATPHMFRPGGLISFQGRPHLNIYMNRAIKPAEGVQMWGLNGNFPFCSDVLENLFTTPYQLMVFLAWWKHYYLSALEVTPSKRQILFLMGGVNIGKSLVNELMIGASVGGYIDAGEYLIDGAAFNSEFLSIPHWGVDDKTTTENPAGQAKFHNFIKRMSANEIHGYRKKFETGGSARWCGGIGIGLNTSYVSSRGVLTADKDTLDKLIMLKCSERTNAKFGTRPENEAKVMRELPYLMKWVKDLEIPLDVPRDERFGYKAYHEPSLLIKARQTSKFAPFKELLVEYLKLFFQAEPTATEWRGGATILMRAMCNVPGNNEVMRSLRLESITKYLEMLLQEGMIKCRVEDDEHFNRVWVFDRFGSPAKPPQEIPPITNQPLNQNEPNPKTT